MLVSLQNDRATMKKRLHSCGKGSASEVICISTLPIDILLWSHGVSDLLCVYFVDGVQWQLHNESVHRRVLVHLFNSVKDLKEGKQTYNSGV